MKKTIGIIGFGNMGSAIGRQLKTRFGIFAYDKDKNKVKNIRGINAVDNISGLLQRVDAVILAVKPQDFAILLGQISGHTDKKLLISIAAGISTDYIERYLKSTKVVRAMPNLLARIGKGITCLCKGANATKKDLIFARELFNYLGKTMILKEERMDAATAISGSGPGYLYGLVNDKGIKDIEKYAKDIFIPALTKAAEGIGFSRKEARFLSVNTGRSGHIFLKEAKLSPAEALKQVASKGGTTEAALAVLRKKGTLTEAVRAALKRAQQLARR